MRKRRLNLILISILSTIFFINIFLSHNAKALELKEEGHWAKEEINALLKEGLVKGYEDGSFRPDNQITRAEFMALINRVFEANLDFEKLEKETLKSTYSDLHKNKWYYDSITKALKSGYIKGYEDGTIKPENTITREEAAVIIHRILDLDKKPEKTKAFNDSPRIQDWSKCKIGGVVNKGYIGGYPDITFRPENEITRAESAVMIKRIMDSPSYIEVLNQRGIYGKKENLEIVKCSLKIKECGTTLQNKIINGNLFIDENVGEGKVVLKNVIVNKDTYIHGGGENSIYLDDSEFSNIILDKEAGIVRVLIDDSTADSIILKSSGIIEEMSQSNSSHNITISEEYNGSKNPITLSGTFETLKIKSQTENNDSLIKIQVENGTTLNEVIIDSKTSFQGKGRIKKAYINASGVVFENEPDEMIISQGIEKPTIINQNNTGSSSSSSSSNRTRRYSLSLISNPNEGGTVTGEGNYRRNTLVDILATPSEGYEFINWTINEEELSKDSSFSYSMPSSNTTLTANFEEIIIKSSENNITSFTVDGQIGESIINTANKTVELTMPYASNISELTPEIQISEKAQILPESGQTQDFSSDFTYTVTAEDGTEQIWTVKANKAEDPSGFQASLKEEGGKIESTSFKISLSNAKDIEGNLLNGNIEVNIISDKEGEGENLLSEEDLEFTDGSAEGEIELSKALNHELTISVDSITENENLEVNVYEKVSFNGNTNIDEGFEMQPYTYSFNASGGTGEYEFSIVDDNGQRLPDGLELSTGGAITGTISQGSIELDPISNEPENASKEFDFKVKITDTQIQDNTKEKTFIMPINLFAGGDGDQATPFEIETPYQLDMVRHFLNDEDIAFKLVNDIDLEEYINKEENPGGWEPIGTNSSNYFRGTFNGNGYLIDNLFINKPDKQNIGFFGYANSATIDSLGLLNVDITGRRSVGSILGLGESGTIIQDSFAKGNVDGDSEQDGSDSGYYIGGLVGITYERVIKSYFKGDVTGIEEVGGLAGRVGTNASIENSYAIGTITGEDKIGGLAGRNRKEIINSYSASDINIIGSNGDNIGGLVGDGDDINIENSYYDKSLFSETNQYGEGKTTDEMFKEETFSNWDFDSLWTIKEEESYPYLKWQED